MSRLTAHDRDRAVRLLAERPLPEVRRLTGLAYQTLARLQRAAERVA